MLLNTSQRRDVFIRAGFERQFPAAGAAAAGQPCGSVRQSQSARHHAHARRKCSQVLWDWKTGMLF